MITDLVDKLKTDLNKLVNTFELNIQTHIKECVENNYENCNIESNTNNDLELTIDGCYFLIDIKQQDINKTYSFPNMISIKKAKDILSDINNNIIYVFIEYEKFEEEQLDSKFERYKIEKIRVQKIESLKWDYLYIQNLGRGQLQIKNISKQEFTFNNDVSREEWLKKLKEYGLEYYNNLMLKIVEYKSEWEDNESMGN